MCPDQAPVVERVVGRYVLCDEVASGGMATVHIGRLVGSVGFARTVAIKRLHAQFAKDPEFSSMLLDEARVAARIRHPNVVSTLDVVVDRGELLIVMDYVQGESLARLVKAAFAADERPPVGVVMSIIAGVLYGLHAAHEATDDHGVPLGVIHRDVSPQNIMVGLDGVARALDFGVAQAMGRAQTTREGTLKGKLAYMSPEQAEGESLDRRSDIFSASVVLWEMVVGRRLFRADNEAATLKKVLMDQPRRPSELVPGLPASLDALVMKGLARDREGRFATAWEMAEEAQRVAFATTGEVGAWVRRFGGGAMADRAERVAMMESRAALKAQALAAESLPDTPPQSSPATPAMPPRSSDSLAMRWGPPPPTQPTAVPSTVRGAALETVVDEDPDNPFDDMETVPANTVPAPTAREAPRPPAAQPVKRPAMTMRSAGSVQPAYTLPLPTLAPNLPILQAPLREPPRPVPPGPLAASAASAARDAMPTPRPDVELSYPRPRARGRALLIVAAAMVAGSLAALVLWPGSRPDVAAADATSASAASPSAAPAVSATPADTPSPLPVETQTELLRPPTTIVVTPPLPARPVPATPPVPAAPRPPLPPPPPPPPPPVRSRCNPPYTVNAGGIRIPKPECL